MSITLMTAAWKTALPSTKKLVLLALCDNANDQGECYPSVPNLIGKCSLAKRSVQSAIVDLQALNYVRRVLRPGHANLYLISDPAHWGDADQSATLAAAAKSEAGPRPARTGKRPPPVDESGAAPAHVQQVHRAADAPTPAAPAPPPVQVLHPTRAAPAPITITEPSVEPSLNLTTGPFVLPDDIDRNAWTLWDKYRSGKGWTADAKKLNARRMLELAAAGENVMLCVQRSIERTWTGLFPVPASQKRMTKDEGLAAAARTAFGDDWPPPENVIDV